MVCSSRWRYTDPAVTVADGLVPFFIDWGTSPHPALTAAKGATLINYAPSILMRLA